jgi:hypothetical protein
MLGVMADVTHDSDSGRPTRIRRIGARALTVVAILLALVGMLAFYVEHTILDEEGFETISREMIESDEIRTQVATTAVDRLFANVDVERAADAGSSSARSRSASSSWGS